MSNLGAKKTAKGQRATVSGSFPFVLEPYRGPGSRYDCPDCGKRREFTRYIDRATGQYINELVGKCNRIKKCGYHLSPKKYFTNHGYDFNPVQNWRDSNAHLQTLAEYHAPDYIPAGIVLRSLKSSRPNHFRQYLANQTSEAAARYVCELYGVGSSNYWPGATVFWQIDRIGRTRTGKVMLYNPETGRRVKGRQNWAHAIMKRRGHVEDFRLCQCLFGEHLLPGTKPETPVGIVESEKTAVILTLQVPGVLFLATGGINNLKASRMAPLMGRDVILYPDAGCYEDWQVKAMRLADLGHRVRVSELLRNHATEAEKNEGWDLADYLLPVEI